MHGNTPWADRSQDGRVAPTRRAFLRAAGGAAAALALGELAVGRPSVAEAAATRPIADFLGAQGTTATFFPPVPDYLGWNTPPPKPTARFALVDYAGLADAFLGHVLGTTATGSVTERPLADGRAEVTVLLRTANALTWVTAGLGPTDTPELFGALAQEVAQGATPALATSQFKVVFDNTAPGALLPDLVAAFILGNAAPGQALVSIAFTADATGPLHAGFGVPEGTPGRCSVVQNGLFFRAFSGVATAGGFPAESIDLNAVGG